MTKLSLCAVVVLLAGCTGQMQGLVHSPAGEPMGAAVLTYTTYGLGTGSFTVAMPDGEQFTGNATEVTARSPGSSWYGYGNQTVDTGTAVGSALGNRGHSMQCQFQGEDRGTGRCVVSDGRVVDLTF